MSRTEDRAWEDQLEGDWRLGEDFPLWGAADYSSVFGFTLLIGLVLVALGGFLAVQGQPGAAEPAPPTGRPAPPRG